MALAAPYYLYLLLILFLNRSISADTPTSIRFYSDTACKILLYTIQTDTNIGNGTCTPVSGVSSVYPDPGDSGCGVTVYSDIASAYCSNAALALFGQCTALPIKSFTVDCQINGTNTGNYTTIYPSSGETSTPSATPPTTLSSITGTNPLISTNSSSSSLAPSSSSQTSSASSTSAPPPSPSPSQAPKQGDGNGGLSRAGRIGLGTGLGVLGLVGMVVYGAQKWRKRRARQSGSSDINMNAIQPRQEQSTTLKSESESSVNGNIRQSDTFSCANSSFRSIPKERPGKLYE